MPRCYKIWKCPNCGFQTLLEQTKANHQHLTFGEAARLDMAKYGQSGGFWKKAYGSPKKGDWITDDYVVTFSGDYTISIGTPTE